MRTLAILLFLTLALLAMCGCAQNRQAPPQTPEIQVSETTGIEKPTLKTLKIKTAFENGGRIPRKYTCDGIDISPPIEIYGIERGVKSIVIIFDDPDAPHGVFTHWLAWNITWNSSNSLKIPEGVPRKRVVEIDGLRMVQGKNDFGKIGYGGPCPPSGTHRYFLKVYAIDTYLRGDYSRKELLKIVDSHTVQYGEVYGVYGR